MDQYERVKYLVERITYKPRWEIAVSRTRNLGDHIGRYDIPAVWISVKLPAMDVHRPNREITLQNQKCFWEDTLESMTDKDIIKHCICNVLLDTERHELDEWFKFDGIQIFDPHHEGVTK